MPHVNGTQYAYGTALCFRHMCCNAHQCICFSFALYSILSACRRLLALTVYSNGVRADCAVRHVFRIFSEKTGYIKAYYNSEMLPHTCSVQTNLYGVLIALHFTVPTTPQTVLWICFVNREFI